MEYNVVSGDSHIDMSWLPGDLFVRNCDNPQLRTLMPHIEETEQGSRWVAEGDNVLGVALSAGFEFIPPQKGRWRRTDKMLEHGFYDGAERLTNPELRLKDMLFDGVDAEIIYGITGAGKNLKNHDVIAEVYRIYNDWVNDFCNSVPGRWYGLGCLPLHDAELAGSELRRIAEMKYIRGADLMASNVTYPIYTRDGYWDPVWRASAETGLSISFHLGGSRISVPSPPGGSEDLIISDRQASQNEMAYRGVTSALGQLSGVQHFCSILMSGALEKYPGFKFVMGEAGAAWIPFVLNRLDHAYFEQYFDKYLEPPMPNPPSEYWTRQGFTTFQEEPAAGQFARIIGLNKLMWGSDYPHPDSVWPDSQQIIQDTLGNLEPGEVRQIVRDNAVNLYGVGK